MSPASADDPDDFRFGRRQIVTQDHTGQPRYTVVPLTPADVLDPQPDDDFNTGARHAADIAQLAVALRAQHRYNPTIAVITQTKLLWPGLAAGPAPDIALVDNLREPTRRRPVLDLAAEGASVRAVFEVVAPLFAHQDCIDKPTLYAAAGIRELWLIDCGVRPGAESVHYTITGFVLDAGAYRLLEPDADGRWYSQAARAWLAVTPDAGGILVGDPRTGKIIDARHEEPSTPAAQTEAKLRAESIASQLDFLR